MGVLSVSASEVPKAVHVSERGTGNPRKLEPLGATGMQTQPLPQKSTRTVIYTGTKRSSFFRVHLLTFQCHIEMGNAEKAVARALEVAKVGQPLSLTDYGPLPLRSVSSLSS